jgi:hypothetical protein
MESEEKPSVPAVRSHGGNVRAAVAPPVDSRPVRVAAAGPGRVQMSRKKVQ